MQPKVSVIIPVYNVEPYLRQCLDSIINQTLQEIEIICIDDGSTDTSPDILEEYAAKDPRFILLHQKNAGAGAARNKGLQNASGEYLSFLDSDDFFELRMLECCYDKLKSEKSDIVVYSARQIDMRTGKTSEMPWSLRVNQCPHQQPFSSIDMSKYIFNTFQNWTWNKMFKASFIFKHHITFQEIPRTNDMAFVCLALALAHRISIINIQLCTYRIGTTTSLQSTNDKTPLAFWDACVTTKNLLKSYGCYDTFKQSYLNAVLGGTFYNLRSVKSSSARHDIEAIIKYHAEGEFGFSKLNDNYFYNKNDYNNYISFLRTHNLSITKDIDDSLSMEYKKLIKKLKKYNQINSSLEKEFYALCSSVSFRIGRAITLFSRIIRDIYRYHEDRF